ncbi:hypothetical protein [Noviherbaspirillum galbum]|uniref:Antitoxin Xre/MbcA/ParS-like toxin-binding domain-containing protein n=1 Tax=Noviherbaspirillum galbum TaxID=2709383 RepID=A0A6B3SZM4_9BURK|nr:hypothetical protein [Noviherbaspirillum galbum]NEX64902.1 hypothetical protein [Noviherbaspirillum galbum]
MDVAKSVFDEQHDLELWYINEPIPVFEGFTAQRLVEQGRVNALLRYLRSLDAGFCG